MLTLDPMAVVARARVVPSLVDTITPWGMLLLRPALAVVLQTLVAIGFLLFAAPDPWRAAADWWLGWFAVASVINLALLRALLGRDGVRVRDFYLGRVHGAAPADRGGDLRWTALAITVAAPLGVLPNIVLSSALWADPTVAGALTFRPLPVVAAVAILCVFPIVHALAELPTYFGYVMPRVVARVGQPAFGVILCASVLSVQHVFLPLLFDWRYIVWRAFMFLPFALWFGFVIHRRPTTLPYLVVAHALLDASLPIAVLMTSLSR